MTTCCSVLIEVVSIQKYIFQSNTLKTNLGASHLIQHQVFGEYLKESVREILGNGFDWEKWRNTPAEIRIAEKKDAFEIGYIGGGNALLFFAEPDKAQAFVRNWTRRLMTKTPGIVTAVAIEEKFDVDNFSESRETLFKKLNKNKAKLIPQTTLPRHGITAECNVSGLSAEIYDPKDKKHISFAINAKDNAAKDSRDHFHNLFQEKIGEGYDFTDRLEELGSISEKASHIAVVHIDGNRMALRFKECGTLPEIRELSESVRKATEAAFGNLLSNVVDHYDKIMTFIGFDNWSKDERYQYPMDKEFRNKILPIMPLVLGGDDVTFVCDGKLGVYFSKLFIEAFERETVSDNLPLTACAGVAITKMKYPFYRGYKLAEDLCKSAKKLNQGEDDAKKMVSALDFHIAMGGIFGSLEDIKKNHFTVPGGNLLYRPYKLISADSPDPEKSFDLMLRLTADLKRGKNGAGKLANNKIKELRNVLTLSEDACKQFVRELKFRGKGLPDMPGRNYSEKLFENEVTPYFDMIELAEFFPDFALEGRVRNEDIHT